MSDNGSKKNSFGYEFQIGTKVYFGPLVANVPDWADAGIEDGPDGEVVGWPKNSRISAIVQVNGRKQVCLLDAIRPVSVREQEKKNPNPTEGTTNV